ncbi:MAG: type II secretion system protein GspC [Polyangiales bacterium]
MQLSWQPKQLRVVILLVTLGLCAFFLAQGIANLVALKLLPYHPQAANGSTGNAPGELKGDTPPDSVAILHRNIFDPQTGSLPKPEPEPQEEPDQEPASDEDADENHLPAACDGNVRLVASMFNERDEAWSFASLSLGTGSPLLYRSGGAIETRKVHAIYPKAVLLKNSNGSLCSLTMFKPANEPPKPATPVAPAPPAIAEAGGATDPDLDKGITQQSETKYSVRRSLVDKLLQNQGELMRSARVVPHEENGRVVGVKLYGIRKSSLFGKLGLQNGDMLRTINGFDMGSPDSALEAYAKLRSASNLSVALVRRGNAMTMDYNISN